MNLKLTRTALVLFALGCLIRPIATDAAETAYPPLPLPAKIDWGRNIQRTMRLLANSTPEQRHTVRILFYGQSITEQRWARLVEDDLRRRFPHAHLVVENRALAGFSSQLLVKTAETDLYPFQPDLVIFHVYGAHNAYEDIIRRTRERTTAEILMQTDHVTKPADLTEETDPAKLPPSGKHWDAFMNQHWLPLLARKYQAELCDQRSLWKTYLNAHHLEPKALLRDNVHLNAHGEWLMAQCVNAWLRYDPALPPSPAESWVKTIPIGRDVQWQNGALQVPFDGNAVDVIFRNGTGAPTATVRIDGRKPSEWPELYAFTRAVTTPPGKWAVKWPIVAPLASEAALTAEDWTLALRQSDTNGAYRFVLTGSKTGQDGVGSTRARFVSQSRRIVVETNAWNIAYSLSLAGIKPPPEAFEVKWKSLCLGVDEFAAPAGNPDGIERSLTLAQGLPNGPHVLEIKAGEAMPIIAIRVHQPPLKPASQSQPR